MLSTQYLLLNFVLSGVIAGFIALLILKNTQAPTPSVKAEHEGKKHDTKRILSTLFFVLSGIPLCIYSIVMLVNLLLLVGGRSGNENVFLIAVVYLFILFSSLYPLTYFLSLFLYRKRARKLFFSMIPLVCMLIIAVLGYISRLLS
jgi:hypothetical protein